MLLYYDMRLSSKVAFRILGCDTVKMVIGAIVRTSSFYSSYILWLVTMLSFVSWVLMATDSQSAVFIPHRSSDSSLLPHQTCYWLTFSLSIWEIFYYKITFMWKGTKISTSHSSFITSCIRKDLVTLLALFYILHTSNFSLSLPH